MIKENLDDTRLMIVYEESYFQRILNFIFNIKKVKAVRAKMNNKRRYKRYRINKPIKIFESDYNEKLLNFSRTGCCISSPHIQEVYDIILISWNKHYRVGMILWKTVNKHNQNIYGIKFLNKSCKHGKA